MIHYTMVKTTMFNGVSHPSIGMWTLEDKFELFRVFLLTSTINRGWHNILFLLQILKNQD